MTFRRSGVEPKAAVSRKHLLGTVHQRDSPAPRQCQPAKSVSIHHDGFLQGAGIERIVPTGGLLFDRLQSGEKFQDLCCYLLIAEYGTQVVVVDGAGGDGGLDCYDPETRTLWAMYRPRSRTRTAKITEKARADIEKAVQLTGSGRYLIDRWIFMTSRTLTESGQAKIRSAAEGVGFRCECWGESHIILLWQKHRVVHDLFPELQTPSVLQSVDELKAMLGEQCEEPPTSQDKKSAPPANKRAKIRDPIPGPDRPLFDLLMRGAHGDATVVPELRKLAGFATEPVQRLWASVILLKQLNVVDDVREVESEARRLRARAVALGIERFVVYSDLKIVEVWSCREFGVGQQFFSDTVVKRASERDGLSEKDWTGGTSKEMAVSAQMDTDHRLCEVIESARSTGETDLLIEALELQGRVDCSRALLWKMSETDPVAMDRAVFRCRRSYETALDLAQMLGDPALQVLVLKGYSRSLNAFGEGSMAAAAAERALDLCDAHAMYIPDWSRRDLKRSIQGVSHLEAAKRELVESLLSRPK